MKRLVARTALMFTLAAPAVAGELVSEDLKVGDGDTAVEGATIVVHYTGWLSSGEAFDSSEIRGEPFRFRLGNGEVIAGWDQGMVGMKEGGVRKLVIPPEMAYGDEANGRIPPGETLTYQIRLLDVGKVRRPPERPTYAGPWDDVVPGVTYADLTTGAPGNPIQEGSRVKAEVSAWRGEKLVDSTLQRSTADNIVPGSGRHSPAMEKGLLNAVAGTDRLLRIDMGEGADPLIVLLQVLEVSSPRKAPEAPQTIPEDQFTHNPSGLQYAELVQGEGEEATPGRTVVVEYTGWLQDGGRFDSSYLRDSPFSFTLGGGQVIAGWEEGVEGMRVGGTRQLIIPSHLGYGDRGAPPDIPAFSTLIFEVKLLEVL